ncbi:putative uncharacterized protein DDB_G0290521 [Abrus precatorius]|uniref:Uncharacterized protein n=1 Tax=Abrus precatorius TaxID=3816 RepID=A0A8B8KMD5_ABRPR|nr:putative uncharacterized protein DDB_G0290521 [Abrus precatorius]
MTSFRVKVWILPSEEDVWVFDAAAQQSIFHGMARVIHGQDVGLSWTTHFMVDTPIELVFSTPPGDSHLPYPALIATPSPMSVDPRTPSSRPVPTPVPFPTEEPTPPPVTTERDTYMAEPLVRNDDVLPHMLPTYLNTYSPFTTVHSPPRTTGWIVEDTEDAASSSSASPTSSEESDPIEDYSPLD